MTSRSVPLLVLTNWESFKLFTVSHNPPSLPPTSFRRSSGPASNPHHSIRMSSTLANRTAPDEHHLWRSPLGFILGVTLLALNMAGLTADAWDRPLAGASGVTLNESEEDRPEDRGSDDEEPMEPLEDGRAGSGEGRGGEVAMGLKSFASSSSMREAVARKDEKAYAESIVWEDTLANCYVNNHQSTGVEGKRQTSHAANEWVSVSSSQLPRFALSSQHLSDPLFLHPLAC